LEKHFVPSWRLPCARCDSCGVYLKSIDMTKDAEALPVPDDGASSAINIWTFEQGLPGYWEKFSICKCRWSRGKTKCRSETESGRAIFRNKICLY
jgi:formate dehydrogenase maturation protein FdhE